MPTTVSFGTITLVANQAPVFVPDANGQNLPPGLNFDHVELHLDISQVPDGTYLSYEADWSPDTGNSTNWDHTGGAAFTTPTRQKDGTLTTVYESIHGIPAGSRRGRMHIKAVSQNAVLPDVSAVVF